jgi:hypothetical protein
MLTQCNAVQIITPYGKKRLMAEALKNDVVVGLSENEVEALINLFDNQETLDPRLNDLNNTLQAL